VRCCDQELHAATIRGAIRYERVDDGAGSARADPAARDDRADRANRVDRDGRVMFGVQLGAGSGRQKNDGQPLRR